MVYLTGEGDPGLVVGVRVVVGDGGQADPAHEPGESERGVQRQDGDVVVGDKVVPVLRVEGDGADAPGNCYIRQPSLDA